MIIAFESASDEPNYYLKCYNRREASRDISKGQPGPVLEEASDFSQTTIQELVCPHVISSYRIFHGICEAEDRNTTRRSIPMS